MNYSRSSSSYKKNNNNNDADIEQVCSFNFFFLLASLTLPLPLFLSAASRTVVRFVFVRLFITFLVIDFCQPSPMYPLPPPLHSLSWAMLWHLPFPHTYSPCCSPPSPAPPPLCSEHTFTCSTVSVFQLLMVAISAHRPSVAVRLAASPLSCSACTSLCRFV